jgi:DNA-binding MarR family transcriptional regulator
MTVPQDEVLKLENQLCFPLYAAANALQRTFRTLLRDLGLTYPQYLVMLVLWEEGRVTVKDLGQKLFLDSGTLTPLLKRLESAGLVNRRRSQQDERRVEIGLTDHGHALRELAVRVPEKFFMLVSKMPLDDLASLHRNLLSMRELLHGSEKEMVAEA